MKHYARTTLIEYYDGDPETTEMNDAKYSTALANGTETNAVNMETIIGKEYYFIINNTYGEGLMKNTSFDKFFATINYDDADYQIK